MRVLITGGAGFIGSNLVRTFVRAGHHVLNLDKLTYAGRLDSLSDVAKEPNYELVVGDICDQAAVSLAIERFQPDWVAHLAAESHVDRSIDSPSVFVQTNVVGTVAMLQTSQNYWSKLDTNSKQSFRFLHVSTDEVFGSLLSEGRFNEATRYDPHSPYAASKAASDHFVRAWNCTYGLPVIIVNCSNNFGPFQFPEKFVPVVILHAIASRPIPVYGNGLHVRDWIYVEDHCRALDCVLRQGRVGETYNIGGGGERTNFDLATEICEVLDKLHPRPDGKSYKSQIEFVSDRPGHDFRYAVDASKLTNQLGWRPTHTLSTGLETTVLWYLENEWWYRDTIERSESMSSLG